jgi:hypothetical protein
MAMAVPVASVLGLEDATTTLRVDAHLFDRPRTYEAVRVALSGGVGFDSDVEGGGQAG